jgi:hypothetical protein
MGDPANFKIYHHVVHHFSPASFGSLFVKARPKPNLRICLQRNCKVRFLILFLKPEAFEAVLKRLGFLTWCLVLEVNLSVCILFDVCNFFPDGEWSQTL